MNTQHDESEKETKEYPNTLENNQFTIFQVYKGKLDKLFGVWYISDPAHLKNLIFYT